MDNTALSTETTGKPITREAFLKRPAVSRAGAFRPLLKLLAGHLLVLPVVALLIVIYAGLKPYTGSALWIAIGVTAAVFAPLLWWMEFGRPRRLAEKRRADTLALAQTPVSKIAFSDGSISDFVPEGVVLLRNGWALAFDIRRQLTRQLIVKGPGRIKVEMDWVWGWEERPRFEVTESQRRGWLRRKRDNGFMLGIVTPAASRPVLLPIQPGFEAEARRLSAAANRAIAQS